MTADVRRPSTAPTRRVPPALALVAGLLLAACGGGSTVRQTSALPSDVPDPINVSAGTLKLTDFPAGWTITEDEESDEADAEDDFPCGEVVDTNDVDSKTFEKDDAQISNSLSVYETVAAATSDFATIRDPNLTECLRREFEKYFNEQYKDDGVAVTVAIGLTPAQTVGDETIGIRLTMTFTGPGGSAVSYMDIVAVRVGRVVASYLAITLDQPFDTALRDQLIDVTVKRTPRLT